MQDVTRRRFITGAGLGAATLGAAGLLAGCAKETTTKGAASSATDNASAEATAEMLVPTKTFDATTGHNFTVEPESKTKTGTTLENLKSAVQGETNATTKYTAWAEVAKTEGYSQLERLFRCTADAEKTHIELETALIKKSEPNYTAPKPEVAAVSKTDMNAIHGAQGEIYETSDMYPSFIEVAKKENNQEAIAVFTRAKLAEAYHAQHYMDAYNTIDTPSKDKYYRCPICGYIHRGENFSACPICLTPKSQFKAY